MFDDSRYQRKLPGLRRRRSIFARVCLAYIGAYIPAGSIADGDPPLCPGASPSNSPVPSSFWMF